MRVQQTHSRYRNSIKSNGWRKKHRRRYDARIERRIGRSIQAPWSRRLHVEAVEVALAAGEVDLRRVIEQVVEWTWKALHPVPPDLLRTFAAMAYTHPAFAELSDQYDRYERQALARVLGKLTSRERVRSPLAAARVLDIIVPTVGIWTALHPDDARGVKEAMVEMIYRFLAEGGNFTARLKVSPAVADPFNRGAWERWGPRLRHRAAVDRLPGCGCATSSEAPDLAGRVRTWETERDSRPASARLRS